MKNWILNVEVGNGRWEKFSHLPRKQIGGMIIE